MALRALELFAGTHSFGKWAERKGYEVVSLDIKKSSKSTHTTDILLWDYRMYPVGHFDIIWASPDCTQFSQARTTGGPPDLEGAGRLVKRALEIIAYFKPRRYALENPWTGKLKSQDFMRGLPYTKVDYCQFSTVEDSYPYRKRTAIWSDRVKADRLCDMKCGGMNEGGTGHTGTFCGVRNLCLSKKHRVPQGLFEYIFSSI